MGVGPEFSHGMVERLGLTPLSHERWAEDDSSVDIIRVTETLSVLATCGPGHIGARPFYERYAPQTCQHPESVIFRDLGSLTSTELTIVRTCIGIGKDNRHNLAAVHMFYDSPMVGMAVTVANVALGGIFSLYREAEPFVEAFNAAARPLSGST